MFQQQPAFGQSNSASLVFAEKKLSKGEPKRSIAHSVKVWTAQRWRSGPKQQQHHQYSPSRSQENALSNSLPVSSSQHTGKLNCAAGEERPVRSQEIEDRKSDAVRNCDSDLSFSSETTAGGSWSSYPTLAFSPKVSSAVSPVCLPSENPLSCPEGLALAPVHQAGEGGVSVAMMATAKQNNHQKAKAKTIQCNQKPEDANSKAGGSSSKARSSGHGISIPSAVTSGILIASAASPDMEKCLRGAERCEIYSEIGDKPTQAQASPGLRGILKPYRPRKHRCEQGFTFKRTENAPAPQHVGDVGAGQKVSFGKVLHTVVYHYEQVHVPSEATPWIDVGALKSFLFSSGGKATYPKSTRKQAASNKSKTPTDASCSVPVEYSEQIMIPLPQLESFVQEDKNREVEDLSLDDLCRSFGRTKVQSSFPETPKSASFSPSSSRRLGQTTPVKSSSAKPVSRISRTAPPTPLTLPKGAKRRTHTDSFMMGHRAL